MKQLTSIILILFLSLLSSPSWSETLTMDDLVERNDLYYKKFTNVPFSGEISGIKSGSIKKGRKYGEWVSYHKNGQLHEKGNYKDGKKDGLWEEYYKDGQFVLKGNFKDGKKDGLWEWYYENGSLQKTETWKNGERISCDGDC